MINAFIRKILSILEMNVEEEFSVVFKYVAASFFSQELIGCVYDSYLLFDNLYEIFVYKSSDQDIILNFGRQKYMLPGSKLANKDFSTVFNYCLNSYPKQDSKRLLGFKSNEEMKTNY